MAIPIGYLEVAFGYFMYNNLSYLPELVLFMLQFVGIRKYIIAGDKEKYKRINKRIQKETLCTGQRYLNGKQMASGFFVSSSCFGKYENSSRYIEEEYIILITSETYFKYLDHDDVSQFTKDTASDEEKKPLLNIENKKSPEKNINVYIRTGNYKNFYYKQLSLDVTHIEPLNGQDIIVKDILQIYHSKNRATVFINGVSCAGKSSVGYLLAKAINASYCHTFNPSDPGDSLTNLVSEIRNRNDCEENGPLVIVIEEANEIIKAIHSNNVKINQEVPTPIRDKSSWCTFLDDMIFYKNVILILTSNDSKTTIDELDPSYLRPGRIHATFSMMTPISQSSL